MPVPEIEKLLRQSSAELDAVQLIKKIEVVDQGAPGASSTIAVTHLTDGKNTGGSATTASITPTANTLVLVSVTHTYDGSDPGTLTSISGCSMTWVLVASTVRQNQFTSYVRTEIWRGMSATPTTGALTLSIPGGNGARTCWSVDQFANVVTTGTNGSDAIRNSATAVDSSGPITVTLPAFGDANNVAYGALGAQYGNGTTGTYTISPQGGFTQLAYNNLTTTYANPGLLTEWKVNTVSVQGTPSGANVFMAGVAVEVVAGAPGSGTPGTPVDFDNIPQTFSSLKLIAIARGTAAASADTAWMKINGDTGAYYDYQYLTGAAASAIAGEVFATPNGIPLANIAGASAAANVFGGFEATIFGYAGASEKCVLSKSAGGNRVTGQLLPVEWVSFWRNTSAITRITLNTNLFFLVGSVFSLYGVK